MRDLLAVLGQFALLMLAVAVLLMGAAVMMRQNPYDLMPIRCGAKLKDTCPPTGINWGRR